MAKKSNELPYIPYDWRNKTFEMGDDHVIAQLNHMEDGVDAGDIDSYLKKVEKIEHPGQTDSLKLTMVKEYEQEEVLPEFTAELPTTYVKAVTATQGSNKLDLSCVINGVTSTLEYDPPLPATFSESAAISDDGHVLTITQKQNNVEQTLEYDPITALGLRFYRHTIISNYNNEDLKMNAGMRGFSFINTYSGTYKTQEEGFKAETLRNAFLSGAYPTYLRGVYTADTTTYTNDKYEFFKEPVGYTALNYQSPNKVEIKGYWNNWGATAADKMFIDFNDFEKYTDEAYWVEDVRAYSGKALPTITVDKTYTDTSHTAESDLQWAYVTVDGILAAPAAAPRGIIPEMNKTIEIIIGAYSESNATAGHAFVFNNTQETPTVGTIPTCTISNGTVSAPITLTPIKYVLGNDDKHYVSQYKGTYTNTDLKNLSIAVANVKIIDITKHA